MARQGEGFHIPKRSPLLRLINVAIQAKFQNKKLELGLDEQSKDVTLETLRQSGRKELAKFTKGLEEASDVRKFEREEEERQADINLTKTRTEDIPIGRAQIKELQSLEFFQNKSLEAYKQGLQKDELTYVNGLTLRRDKKLADLRRLESRYSSELMSDRDKEIFERNRPKWQADINKIENDILIATQGQDLAEAVLAYQKAADTDAMNWDIKKTSMELNAKLAFMLFSADEAMAFEQTKQAMEFYYTSQGAEGAESVAYRQIALQTLKSHNSNMESLAWQKFIKQQMYHTKKYNQNGVLLVL
ncbi:hypothetical protein LCGC14_0504040 [marine sediment metagenome]|uniref:Uncharacterized protein n=1 Tax=marine sediment metagenome TaxID=412755 RepID=A0A0F9S838_9ZZZZ